jgi:integrase
MPKIPKYYVRSDGLHESIIRVRGADGKMHRHAFRGKTDMEVYQKIRNYKPEDIAPAVAVTFGDMADGWWRGIEPTLQHNTIKSYRPALERAKTYFGKDQVKEITAKQIELFIKDFASTRARKTVVTQLQVIRQILRYAQIEGEIQYNPAQAVSPPRNLPQERREAPSKAQIELIKKSYNAPFGLFAYLIYYTGCRRGEALALTGKDIDRKNKVIHITKSVYHMGNSPHIKSPKTEKGYRDVPLLDALDAVLPKRLPSGYLFSKPDGSLLTNNHITDLYDAYRAATGVTVTPHQIRHGYATALFEAGIDTKTAQTLLGHAQLSTTMDIYTHVRDDMLRAAADAMNAAF